MNSFDSRIEAFEICRRIRSLEHGGWPLVDKSAPLGMGYRFQPIVRPQFAIDVMQMVPKRLGGNVELGRN